MRRGVAKSAKPARRRRSPATERQIAPGGKTVLPIVGIGASAGGLDAFQKLFGAMRADMGVAFVLIQHLDPTRESLTAELVGAHTEMSVVQVKDGMRVEANHVYVIPPNQYLGIRDGVLRLSAPAAPRSLRMAVDFFLRSLAEDQRDNAIGIILSGTGTDGTLGLKEIKAAGGMTMVQDPETVQHDGMPRSAIATGCADYVLPAEHMAAALLSYTQHANPEGPARESHDPLAGIVDLLRTHAKFDFSGYKKGTLRRRTLRRMSLKQLDQMPKYLDLLQSDAAEVQALYKDLLINVTSFFREPASWQTLQEQVIRKLVAEKEADAPVRAWVPACASGEEAYSIAMVLIEEMQAAGKHHRLQVFASDVDNEALEEARNGVYPEGIAAHVPRERLARFFVRGEHCYRVSKELRDTVAFAQQSLVTDPPFSRLDLISCRNLFIYLEPSLQEQLIPLLHFALVDGGYLFLGSAEGIGPKENLFEVVSAKARLYRRIGPTRHDQLRFRVDAGSRTRVVGQRPPHAPSPNRLNSLAPHLLLDRFAPACVIIDRRGEILHFHGRTDDYLAQPGGLPSHDLLVQARSGLRSALRRAIRQSIASNQIVVVTGIALRRGGEDLRSAKVTVEPLAAPGNEAEGLWLVSFAAEPADAPTAASTAPATAEAFASDATLVHQLEYELRTTKEDLQQTIEDLRAANEELLSVNEELQSSNEEMETSKEELQSLNEELTTANSQLEAKITELESTNNDLDNLLTSTNIATIFLDTHLLIRRFTPAAQGLFRLIPTDVGRPISDIAQKFVDPSLLADAAAVLQRPTTAKVEVRAQDGRCYMRQVLQYRTRAGKTEGVVITFSDVAAEALEEARSYAESIVDTIREPLLVLDARVRVVSANQSFYATFRVSREATEGRSLYELGDHEWDIPRLRTLMGEILPRRHILNDFEVRHDFASIGRRTMLLNARVLDRGGRRPDLILVAIEDITERKLVQEALRESESRQRTEDQVRQRQAELAHGLRITTIGELASGLAHELNQPLSAIANGVEACTRYVRSGKGQPKRLLALLEDAAGEALRAAEIVEHLRGFIQKGEPRFEHSDLRDIARVVPRLLAHTIERAKITFRLEAGTRSLPILADRIQIEQVVVNLLQNAIDALRGVRGRDRTILLKVGAAKGRAELSVSDTGTSVSPEAAERLFEPFFTTKSEGLGMGLAISRSIIEAHHGRIWVAERAPDDARGTTIRFALPLRVAKKPARKRRAP